jgi:hypothetical protein
MVDLMLLSTVMVALVEASSLIAVLLVLSTSAMQLVA